MEEQITLKDLTDKFSAYNPNTDVSMIEKAYKYSKEAHMDQKRASGEEYFTHCVATANILLDHRLDLETVCAGLLHDTIEDTPITKEDIEKEFNKEIAHLVEGVTKISDLQFSSHDEETVENWRKMLVAMAKDVRVILIKIADRTHNMQTLRFLDPAKRKEKANETLSLYAPLAQRLGMFTVKNELEDLSFAQLYPDEYKRLVAQVEKRNKDRKASLDSFRGKLTEILEKEGIEFRLLSRAKNYFSIYRKMQSQNLTFNEIQDSLGVRIICKTVGDCYRALGSAHSHFTPLNGSFTDYIAMPKINMYQSIHTTVIFDTGDIVEIQIRTEEMHRTCEYGIAAHWRYKLGQSKNDKNFDERINWLRQWLEWQQDLSAPREFLEGFQTDISLQRVFVFTPKAEVKDLPEGSTPIDFAYAIHGDVGNKYWGAKVNNKMVRMDYTFKTGDICEIITRNNVNPNHHWLEFAKTTKARSRIRKYLKDHNIKSIRD
ncbi:GTP pyrophosphokinase [Parelusimicrobium proximum]|uniref:RelA/SpoT family protein n=1 Tax=Parelusimicrobium proximum TaxID=3228953 RepID=UPI003D179493